MASYNPKSHPTKLLIDHTLGVLSNCELSDLMLIVVGFHDVGKMNDNFQRKIVGMHVDGYSNHSYISCYYVINAFANNSESIKKRFSFINDGNYESVVLTIANIIVGHHGYLRDIQGLFAEDEWNKMVDYLKTIKMTQHVNTYFEEHPDLFNCTLWFTDDLNHSNFYKSFGKVSNIEQWKSQSLKYYFDTIQTYGELVYGDRKDASGNKSVFREGAKKKYAYALENNLEWIFSNFKAQSELNTARNQIRKQAVECLNNSIDSNRIFTLTAPTGCGKTLIMLQLAVEIMRRFNYEHDIIYSLPYLSIIDQTVEIINKDLKIQTLNFTSSSDVSQRLQDMQKEGAASESITEYAFSESCFDHPFIITTFNQLFETLANNSTSKLMRLKNYKKRIFLIDEYQAASPAQYAILVQLLAYFCERNDCYAIISTATMPYLNVDLSTNENYSFRTLVKNVVSPKELLNKAVFCNSVFNRYRINFSGEVNADSLCEMVNQSSAATLLVLNTIKTSQSIYNKFKISNSKFEELYLLNSHISPHDRISIISNIKKDLSSGRNILVVSTQVIEAGVDISFPVLYRDAAPPSSVVQSNGRGNRNGEFGMIETFLFAYREDGKDYFDCNMVYENMMSNNFRNDIINKIPPMEEVEFHDKCERYFYGLSKHIEQGRVNNEQNLIDDILHGKFKSLGKYKFIQGDPESHTIYVGKDEDDWNKFVVLFNEIQAATSYKERDEKGLEFKKIRGKILQNCISVRKKNFELLGQKSNPVFEIHRLENNAMYDSRVGLKI